MISKFLPCACKFIPSCSNYTVGALQKHGVFRGSWFAVKRILKCHPFYNKAGGIKDAKVMGTENGEDALHTLL